MARRRKKHSGMRRRAPRRAALTVSKRFAAEIRRARLAAGLTQAELSARLDKTRDWVAGAERGTRPIYLDDLLKVAEALGMDVLELLARVARATTVS